MQKIYLLRHAQAGFGEDHYDSLSEVGYQQAYRLGQFLAANGIGFSPEQIICGTLTRHRQTLNALWQGLEQQPLQQNSTLPCLESVCQDSQWNEYDHHNVLGGINCDFATAAGIRHFLMQQNDARAAFAEIFTLAIQRWVNSESDEPYFESWPEFRCRVQQALKQAMARRSDTLLVITSGGPISLLAQQLLGAPEQDFLRLNWVLANCGLSRLLHGRNGVRLSSLNDYTAFESTPALITYK